MKHRGSGETVEEVLVDAERELALLADIFEMSVNGDERPLSGDACATLVKMCRSRVATLRALRRQLPVETLNQHAALS